MNVIRRAAAALGAVALSSLLASPAFAKPPPKNTRGDVAEREAKDKEEMGPEWFWMAAEGGVETIDLRTFDADFDRLTVGFIQRSSVGPAAGVGVGARLGFVTLGARGRFASFHDDTIGSTAGGWQLWSLDGEVGLRFYPVARLQPYLTLAAGYSA